MTLRRLDLKEMLLAPPPPVDYVWGGYGERGTLTLVHADGGVGKTLTMLGLARAGAEGRPFLGQPTTQFRTLVIDGENPENTIQRRLHRFEFGQVLDAIDIWVADSAIFEMRRHPADQWADRFLSRLANYESESARVGELVMELQSPDLSPAQRQQVVESLDAAGLVQVFVDDSTGVKRVRCLVDDPGAAAHPGEQMLIEKIRDHGAGLVLLDSQRALWGGKENEADAVRPFYNMLRRVAAATGACIFVIHHDNKSGGFSGSSDLHDSVDSRIHLEFVDQEKGPRGGIILNHRKSRDELPLQPMRYRMTVEDGRYAFRLLDIEDLPPAVNKAAEFIRERESARTGEIAEHVKVTSKTVREWTSKGLLELAGIRSNKDGFHWPEGSLAGAPDPAPTPHPHPDEVRAVSRNGVGLSPLDPAPAPTRTHLQGAG